MRRLNIPLLHNNKAASYAISAIIITATTITLVLVASIYAYQIMDVQKAAAEYEVAKKSILAFDDALENIAWKPNAARSTRFTIDYGRLELMPEALTLSLNATVNSSTVTLLSNSTEFVRYYLSSKYVTFGEGYQSYILGNSSSLIIGSTASYGRAAVNQQGGWVTINLDYRVRAMRTSVVQVGGQNVSYVDIWFIKLKIDKWWSYIHEFDLKAKCLSVTTTTYSFDVVGDQSSVIGLLIGSTSSSSSIELVSGKVVFNIVTALVQVSV